MDKEVELLAKKVITVKNVISRIIGNITIFLVVVKLFRLIQISWLMTFLLWIITFLIFFVVRILEHAFVGYACLNPEEKDNEKMFIFFRKIIKG